MTNWSNIVTFQVNQNWQFSSPVQSNVIKFHSEILYPTLNQTNNFYRVKGLLTLARFEDDSLSNPVFLSPVQIIYPWVTDTQLVIFPEFSLPGTYRIATKISSGNLGSNVWSLDVWEYSQEISTPSTLSSESLTAIQQLLAENNTNPVTLTTDTIAQIAEAVNQPIEQYFPPG